MNKQMHNTNVEKYNVICIVDRIILFVCTSSTNLKTSQSLCSAGQTGPAGKNGTGTEGGAEIIFT